MEGTTGTQPKKAGSLDDCYKMEEYLGSEGVIASRLPGYESRPAQIRMATLVQEAFCNDAKLIVESGTGTGKTLAYLIPAVLSGQKTVISTATKTLQDQILLKDIPFLRKEARLNFRTAQMKGRTNYLCKKRFKDFCKAPLFDFVGDAKHFEKISRWASKTTTGDRAEIKGLSDVYRPWREMSSNADQCLGSKCSDFEDCFISEMRRRAFAADIIIVNHYLYFADLAVRESNFGEVIPGHDAVVFDEAHSLADIARRYFGSEVSDWRIEELVRDIERLLRAEKKKASAALNSMLQKLYASSGSFFELLPSDQRTYRLPRIAGIGKAVEAATNLAQTTESLAPVILAEMSSSEEAQALAERAQAIARELKFIMSMNEDGFVYWCDVRSRSKAVIASPIELDGVLSSTLYSRQGAMIFTSATLSTNGNFSYFKNDMGIPEGTNEDSLESPFDYQNQAVLYLPSKNAPAPQDTGFTEFVTEEMEKLVECAGGRAFLLFTSQRNLDKVYQSLANRLPYNVLKQGDAPKHELLSQFTEGEPAVLFATMSFWQGVDVRGEALSLVAIDKLPFSPPDDPVIQARMEALEKNGRSGFNEIMLPEAILLLKQGLGRLIRTSTDRGVLAVLDKRLVTKQYGSTFLKSLPRFARINDMKEICTFMKTDVEVS